jgi:hypothetical protein
MMMMMMMVNTTGWFLLKIYLQAACLVLIPGNSTGNPRVLLLKEYKMNTDHKNRRAQQTASK